jgi:hypothetical protein
MRRLMLRARWFTLGVLASACAAGFYIYGLGFIAKVRFQWWVWTSELADVLRLGS